MRKLQKYTPNNILSILVFTLLCITSNGQTPWRFAVVGDTHVGSSDIIVEMIPFMIADSIDLVLLPGDIVEGGLACSESELRAELLNWQKIFEPLYSAGIGVFPLRGNHEDDARNNLRAWNSIFTGSYGLPQNGPEGETNLTYSFTHKNALFIGLDVYANIHTVNQNWLDEQLEINTQPHIFVFGHEAAFKVFHSDCLDDSVELRNAFWQNLANAGVKVYFCGHDHFLDVALVDDGDGNPNNDLYQYLVGTGGGWLMSKYNYNGRNSYFNLSQQCHEMAYGYALVEISGDGPDDRSVTITWKERTINPSTGEVEYIATNNIISYTSTISTGDEAQLIDNFNIWPNPASDFIRSNDFKGELTIFNASGVPLWTGSANDSKTINISSLPTGFYIIKSQTSFGKFIKV
ncbi:metallophosphoesterase [Tenuifilum thalassicum]|uniref:T9SS type A sorting domain-containing protein n=1 Tax=Tenuifilum thalassicum TaxID=2590900 RepID=A0A7D3XDW1_9BACT|nr:metallophosphoesterase [Tenuifilum thalassicum]QKG79872.1 T9SS type A sorting domain-containing protein [Tenuifilum thalassicum]